jgi:hypothetical protein
LIVLFNQDREGKIINMSDIRGFFGNKYIKIPDNMNLKTITTHYVWNMNKLLDMNKDDIEKQKNVDACLSNILPIKQVDGVNVNVEVTCYLRAFKSCCGPDVGQYIIIKSFSTIIQLNGVVDDDCEELILYRNNKQIDKNDTTYFDAMQEHLVEFIKNLSVMKLNIYGKFELPDELFSQGDIETNWLDILKDIKNIKTNNIDPCCVCYNLTHTKTDCGHTLCYRCWSNIKDADENENVDYRKPCPMCRECIGSCKTHCYSC